MELNLGQWVVIGICAVLILGYIRGFYYNRKHAGQILEWLYEGLKTLGPVSAGEKLPGMVTGGRLEVKRAAPPFRQVEAVYLLAPRENLLFWVFHRLQGKGDELILWLTFQSKPDEELEVARRGDQQLANRLKDTERKKLTVSDGPRGLQVAVEEQGDRVLAAKLRSFLERYGAVVIRLALRGNKPHIFLRAHLRIMRFGPAAEFLSELSELAK
ncbi:MAG: hypothetical protein JW730_10685 [Anaerolineales bacterium]|nr:hypothetical protein [Anaerolineales bacterium]